MNQIRIILPNKIVLPRKRSEDKVIRLNFNAIKGLYYQTYNEAKIAFVELIQQMNPELRQYQKLVTEKPITNAELTFMHYHGTYHVPDLDNLSFVAKFALDALQKDPKLPKKPYILINDSVKEISDIRHKFIDYDTSNPRVELLISWE